MGPRFPVAEARAQTPAALEYMHARQISHRDLKPAVRPIQSCD